MATQRAASAEEGAVVVSLPADQIKPFCGLDALKIISGALCAVCLEHCSVLWAWPDTAEPHTQLQNNMSKLFLKGKICGKWTGMNSLQKLDSRGCFALAHLLWLAESQR